MSLTNAQKGLLHSVPASLGVLDDQRLMVQRTIGGAESAKDMTVAGFIRCMAFWEGHGWTEPGQPRGHWATQERCADLVALRGKCWKLAALAGWIVPGRLPGRDVDFHRVDMQVRRLFEHTARADTLLACTRDELLKVVEALKSIAVQAGADVHDYHGPARPRQETRRRGDTETRRDEGAVA